MMDIGRGLITGAARGIGAAVAEHLSRRFDTELALADINPRVEETAKHVDGRAYRVDITDRRSVRDCVEKAVSELGRIDYLVNVAGIDAEFLAPNDVGPDRWDAVISTNLTGTWNMTSACLPHLMRSDRGRIVNIASICGVVPTPGVSVAYVAAKAGIVGLTMSLATDLEHSGVLVNAIAPGATGTTGNPMTPGQAADYESAQALGFGGAEPIAQAVGYLLDASGDWVSGSVMNVSGGFWRGR